MAGILLVGSLVSGVGVTGAGAASAGGQTTAGVSQSRLVSSGQQGNSGLGLVGHGLSHHEKPAGTQSAGAVKFAADVRLAVKAALQVVKKRSVGMYNQIIGAARAGKSAFLKWHSNAHGWVKAIFPNVAASILYDAIKWAIGL